MEGEIEDVEIRPCTPPNRMIPEYGHGSPLSAVIEQDEEDTEEIPSATQHGPQGTRRDATFFVFHDDLRQRHEIELSEHQEVLLCNLFTAFAMQQLEQGPTSENFQESRPDRADEYSAGAYIYFQDNNGVTNNLALTSRQAEAIWETRNPDFDWTSSPPVRIPPTRAVAKPVKDKKVKRRNSFLCRIPCVAKLRKKKKNKPRDVPYTYPTVWSRNEFVYQVNGEQTMVYAVASWDPAPSTRFSKATSLFIEATRGIQAAFEYALNKLKKAEEQGPEVSSGDNSRFIFGDATSEDLYYNRVRNRVKVKRFVQRLKRSIARMDPFHSSPELAPLRSWTTPESQFTTSNEMYASVRTWLMEQETSTDPDNLVALTSRELVKLQGKSADRYQAVRPEYQVPPPSPAGSFIAEAYDFDDEYEDYFEGPCGRRDENRGSQDGDQSDSQDGAQDGAQGDGQGNGQDNSHNGAHDDAYEDAHDDAHDEAHDEAHDTVHNGIYGDAHGDAHDESLDEMKDSVQDGAQDETQVEIHEKPHSDVQDNVRHEVQEGVQEADQAEVANSEFETKSEEEEENLKALRRVLLAAEHPYGHYDLDIRFREREEKEVAVIAFATAIDTRMKRSEETEKKRLSGSIPETPIQSEQDIAAFSSIPSSGSISDSAAQPDHVITDADILPLEPADEEFAQKHQLKDLRWVQQHYTGYYIVCPIRHQSLTEVRLNYSDHYFEPMIDPQDGNKIVLGKGYGGRTPETNFSEDFDPEDYIPSDEIPDDEIPNFAYPPRAQAPAQAVILYLLFKGYHIDDIANEMAFLDADFLFKSESRWWEKVRIPQMWQLNEWSVDQVMLVAKADKQWWQEDIAPDGTEVTEAMRVFQGRMRVRKVKRLARKATENYFWWRFMAQRIHCEIPGGHVIREYDN